MTGLERASRTFNNDRAALVIELTPSGSPVPIIQVWSEDGRLRPHKIGTFSFPDEFSAELFGKHMVELIVDVDHDLTPRWRAF